MTKCIVLGEDEKVPIEFKFCIKEGSLLIDTPLSFPHEFENIELLVKKSLNGLDLMLAYNGAERSNGGIYLGHWNDGVV